MASKTVETIEVRDRHHDATASIAVGTAAGGGDGATLAVIGGVHGSEYAAHEAVARFWAALDPAELTGRVLVVLCADEAAVLGKSAYLNPVDGKNLNRVWPGVADGTLTEVIAHAITGRIVEPADAVIDVHGGEWDESIGTFVITHRTGDQALDARTLDLAMAVGFPWVEVTDADGPVLGRGTGSGEAMRAGRPAMTLEAGGAGLAEHRYVRAHLLGLDNALRHLGIKQGPPLAWAGAPVLLDHGVLLKTTAGGTWRPAVSVGDWLAKDGLFAEVLDVQGAVVEQVRAPEEGTVLDVITARGIKAGGFAGKIGVAPPLGGGVAGGR